MGVVDNSNDWVILVNEENEEVGKARKMEAHETPMLHRAFSVLIFDEQGRTLLQQRALSKYHSPGLWSNSCCSHPRPGEDTEAAAHRRLVEELGFDTDLKVAFSFVYKFHDEKTGLWEHEHDTVLTGQFQDKFIFNKDEVKDVQWISETALDEWMEKDPADFTFWFRILWKQWRTQQK